MCRRGKARQIAEIRLRIAAIWLLVLHDVPEAVLSGEESGLKGKKHKVSLLLHLADQHNFCVRMDERFKCQVERFID